VKPCASLILVLVTLHGLLTLTAVRSIGQIWRVLLGFGKGLPIPGIIDELS
jgi:hypothetical protein